MDTIAEFRIWSIGTVESSITNTQDAPHQDNEGAPEAWLVIDRAFATGLEDIKPNQEIWLLTWFHLAERDVLKVHPKNDHNRPLAGVFSTRSPSRPNPIGLHRVRVLEVAGGNRLRVDHLDALHGTPIIDLKPVLDQ